MNQQPHRMAFNAMLVGAGLVLGGLGMWGAQRLHTASTPADAAMATSPAASASAPAAERKVLYWYDPMVPGQKFDKPGKSPFMDMQLVPRYADEGEPAAEGSNEPGLSVSTQAQQALGLRLVTVTRQALGAAVEAVGTVQLNERDIAIVQARTAGFV